MTYQNLDRILDKDWLMNNPNHIYNLWMKKDKVSKEKQLLNNLENYLRRVDSLINSRNLSSKLRSSFVDTYYELEVGCSLMNYGFKVDFEYKLLTETGKIKTPDIFVLEENIIVEVKTLHQSYEIEKGMKTGKVFQFNEAMRVKERVLAELGKYLGIGIKYPLVLILCNDLVNPTILSTDDLETVLLYRIDRGIVVGDTFHLVNEPKYEGLYFADNGLQAHILSGVGLWRGKILCFIENPNVNKESRVPQGRFLSFLKKA